MHFKNYFYYLGRILTTGLSDDRDITVRIRKGVQQVGDLMPFFRNKAVDRDTKRPIFLAIPVNNVPYGCEFWALEADWGSQSRSPTRANLILP